MLSKVLVVTTKEIQHSKDAPITVFCDSQKAFKEIQHTLFGKKNYYLRDIIYNRVMEIKKKVIYSFSVDPSFFRSYEK